MKTEKYNESIRRIRADIEDLIMRIALIAEQGVLVEQSLAIDQSCELKVLENGSVHLVRRDGDLGKQFKTTVYSDKNRLLRIKGALNGVLEKATFVGFALATFESDSQLSITIMFREEPTPQKLTDFYELLGGIMVIAPT